MDGRKSREVLLPFHKTPLGLCAKCKKSREVLIKSGTHLACIFSAILHENYLKYIKYFCVVFIQLNEKSVCAICIPDLISASLGCVKNGIDKICI